MSKKTLIAENEHALAISQEFGGGAVVVTFNDFGSIKNGLNFWGDEFLRKQEITSIGIMTSRTNWYPPDAMTHLIEKMLPVIDGRTVVTYGHSQGGYGALKFGARLSAAVSISFCPQWSIDPSDVETFDRRYTRYFDSRLANGKRVEQGDLGRKSFIFYDERDRYDKPNANRLLALTNVERILCPFSMHDAIRILSEGRGGAKLLRLCLAQNPPTTRDLRLIIRESRAASKTYDRHRMQQLIMRAGVRVTRSTTFVSRALVRHNLHYRIYASFVRYVCGDVDGAAADVAAISALDLSAFGLMSLWQLAESVRFIPAQVAAANALYGNAKYSTFDRLHAVNTFIKTGEVSRATAELIDLKSRSDAKAHIGHFLEFAGRLGKPEIVEPFLEANITKGERVAILFCLSKIHQSVGDRKSTFQRLNELAPLCASTPSELRRVADLLVKIGEFTFALELRERLLQLSPDDPMAALDVIETAIPLNRRDTQQRMHAIVQSNNLSSFCWERAASIWERLGDAKASHISLRRAVEFKDARPEAWNSLIRILLHLGKKGAARKQLRTLLATASDPRSLRFAGDWALKIGDGILAYRFAEAQFRCDSESIGSGIYLARHLRVIGSHDQAHTLLVNYCAESKHRRVSNEQWCLLAEELFELSDLPLAKYSANEVAKRDPKNAAASRILTKIEVLERFGGARPFKIKDGSRAKASWFGQWIIASSKAAGRIRGRSRPRETAN